MKLVDARLVTAQGTKAAQLAVPDAAGDGAAVLYVDGIRQSTDDLPAGAYLEIDDPTIADQAAVAGYFIEPPTSFRRRSLRIVGRFIGLGLVLSMVICIYWVVRDLLALDLLGALAYVGMFFFMGFLALAWLVSGEEILLDDQARGRVQGAGLLGRPQGSFGPGGGKGSRGEGRSRGRSTRRSSRGLTARSGDASYTRRPRRAGVGESENKALVERFYDEVWDRGNVDVRPRGLPRRLHPPRPAADARPPPGPPGWRRSRRDFARRFPDARWHRGSGARRG